MRLLGHRGTGVGEGENTLEAFAEALRLGADGVELDVRRTADGALAVHHDPVIGGLGPLCELAVRELPASVPLLGAALDTLAGAFVNIEVKNIPLEAGFDPDELTARHVAALVGERRLAGSVLVSAFTPASLDAVRQAAPDLATGLLFPPQIDPLEALERAAGAGYAALHPHHSVVTPALIEAVHSRGLAVNVWTVNEPARMRELAGAGVDALITDRVATAVEAVGSSR